MKLRKFNKNKSMKKLQFKRNKDIYIKFFSLSFCVALLIFGIIFFSYAKYESSHEFQITNGVVGKTRERIAVLDKGKIVNGRLKTLAKGSSASYADVDNNVELILRAENDNDAPADKVLISAKKSDYNVYAWYDSGNKIIYYYIQPKEGIVSEHIHLNEDSSYLFSNFTSLKLEKTISGNTKQFSLDDIRTSAANNMSHLFENDSSLTSLDLSNFDTSNVTNMSYMFSGCSGLTGNAITMDSSKFDTSLVVDMNHMFNGISLVDTLDVSFFDTSNVTDMSYMFSDMSSLSSIDVSGFDTDSVENMSHMFNNLSSISTLDVSGFSTFGVKDMSNMFSGMSTITILDISVFKTINVTDMSEMFKGMSLLTTINASIRWKTTNVSSSTNMFKDCTNLVGGAGTTYNANKTNFEYARLDKGPTSTKPGYLTEVPTFLNEYLREMDNSSEIIQDDGTDDHNMRFIGADPNNYITYNGELWRIIGVFNSNTHGIASELVKIVRVDQLDAMDPADVNTNNTTDYGWDVYGSTEWKQSTLHDVLNEGYYFATNYQHYRPESYSATTLISTSSDFTSIGLNSNSRNMIQDVYWKDGIFNYFDASDENAAYSMYSNERKNGSLGHIALPYMSDYIMATAGSSSESRQDCLSKGLNNGSNSITYDSWSVNLDDNCASNSWFVNSYYGNLWSLTTSSELYSLVIPDYYKSGIVYVQEVNKGFGVIPALYLKTNIVCLNCSDEGAGSITKPYSIELR